LIIEEVGGRLKNLIQKSMILHSGLSVSEKMQLKYTINISCKYSNKFGNYTVL